MSFKLHQKVNRHESTPTHRRGAVAVETAICLPILFVMLFGAFEIARTSMMHHATQSAAYEGARVGIIPGATKEKIENASRFILSSVGIRNFTVDVNPEAIDNQTQTVEVTVSVPFRENTFISGFFVNNPTFTGTTVLSREIIR